ncbi:GDSL-type esterase/lipase family protein [Hymenobacter sp. H14-R3]|uniref:GDSL-type esterase/lipase family protein n=1 Tax=Hymenobacter sp. H14-R3 TaxID=3046308 RepID=UPI0024BB4B24|nr:GDSL-type esterase/lipase family protein [Hymenobacter sp. H14-R3]MDJ0365115.1 GDSL-type esterase/lipase family protein [Hymenobacter sp. H14-R3]
MKKVLVVLLALGGYAVPAAAQAPAADRDGLTRYAAANQALPAPQPGRPRVVLLGNSITDAWPRADSAFFASKRYEYVGRGIGGQTSPQLLVRFRQDVLDLHPVAVAILAGINDIAENTGPYDPQATLNNVKSMTELAQASGIRVILCSVLPAYDFPWRKGLMPAPKVLALNQLLKAYAAQRHATYLDYHSAMADSRQGLPPALAKDEVHPTLAGYRIMGPLLEQAVATALNKK